MQNINMIGNITENVIEKQEKQTKRTSDEILLEPTSIVLVGIPLSWPKRLRRANYIFRMLERMFFAGEISKEEIEQIYRRYLEIAEKAFNGLTVLDSRLLYFSLDDWAKLNDDYQTKKMLLDRRGATIILPVNHVVAKLTIIMKLFSRARRTISFSNNIEALEHLRSLQVEFLTKLTEINNELLDRYNLRRSGIKVEEAKAEITTETKAEPEKIKQSEQIQSITKNMTDQLIEENKVGNKIDAEDFLSRLK